MPATLPRLAFGEAHTTPEGGVAGLLAAQRVTHRSLVSYEPLGRDREFRHKSAVVTIGGLRLAASAHTPIRVVVDASDDVALIVPFAGWSTAMIEGREHRWLAGHSAMYLPGVPRRGEAGLRSTLAIGLDSARLEQAARSMAPEAESATIRAALTTPRPVPLAHGEFSFATALRRICGLIDSCFSRPDQLALLGVDDMIYRAVAMMLLPRQAATAVAAQPSLAGRQPIDRACDYVLAHLFSPIRLEDLEAASGLKARALQMAFLKHHGRTPRQWILDRRLDAARARLAEPGAERTITAVALECDFTRLASFSRVYDARFGERPSDTVARRS
jgi:AraC-like DNA-binding protein